MDQLIDGMDLWMHPFIGWINRWKESDEEVVYSLSPTMSGASDLSTDLKPHSMN